MMSLYSLLSLTSMVNGASKVIRLTHRHPCRLCSNTTADNSMVRSMSILRTLVMVGAIEVASVIDRKGLARSGSWFICLSNLTFGHLYFSNWNGGG